jgi:hypothetical protein
MGGHPLPIWKTNEVKEERMGKGKKAKERARAFDCALGINRVCKESNTTEL